MSEAARGLGIALADVAGRVLGGAFFAVGKIRHRDKALHPRGDLHTGRLTRRGVSPPTGVAWLDQPGDDDLLVRLSGAMGVPRRWPEILGVALRTPTGAGAFGDLLFATTGTGTASRFALRPTWAPARRNRYTTLLPYRTPNGPVVLGIFPGPPGGPDFELMCASLCGPWRPFASLQLTEPPGVPTDPTISFDPTLNAIPELEPYDWLRHLRKYAYAGARRARGEVGEPPTNQPERDGQAGVSRDLQAEQF
jgi:hypothetical protein